MPAYNPPMKHYTVLTGFPYPSIDDIAPIWVYSISTRKITYKPALGAPAVVRDRTEHVKVCRTFQEAAAIVQGRLDLILAETKRTHAKETAALNTFLKDNP